MVAELAEAKVIVLAVVEVVVLAEVVAVSAVMSVEAAGIIPAETTLERKHQRIFIIPSQSLYTCRARAGASGLRSTARCNIS